MTAVLADESATPDITDLNFEERVELLVDQKMTERENRRMTSRLRRAKLRRPSSKTSITRTHGAWIKGWFNH